MVMKRLLFALVLLLMTVARAQTPLSQAVQRDESCTAAGGSGTTYTCSITVAPSGYVTNQAYMFVADVANTGTTTINLNALGPKTIKKLNGGAKVDLVANDIGAGMRTYMVYDGTDMRLTVPPGNSASDNTTVNNITVNNSTSVNMKCQHCSLNGTELSNLFPNAGATGTTLNKLAKLTGAGTAVITATTDTGGILGICTGNTGTGASACGTAGSSEIAIQGTFSCIFDGATTQDDYVVNSATVAGDCHDFGATYPVGQQVVGRVLVTAAAGLRSMVLFGPEFNSYGLRSVQAFVLGPTDATTTGNGKYYFVVPATLNNYRLTAVTAQVVSAGTTGPTTTAITRCAHAATGNVCSGATVQMLSTNINVDSATNSSADAGTPPVINTANATITTNQVIRIDISAVSTTPATGLIVDMDFTTP